ncbi:MAG: fibrobacter succinogenes major paralogous domain-containing protein [Candidatus Fibromonas sp.]|jgi:uncharacterized protein (TIGR02145 family)|nr:fibrobacter succinogenes major paralogous domain-containing protein [Candidatus Fibromonas sp.]
MMKSRTGKFTDPRDGKVYKTVKIGKQVWFAENLNFDCKGSKCYNDDPKNAEKYGRLYNWETACCEACPDGWHLPNMAEWETLVDFAGGEDIAGQKLKAKSGWDHKGNGTDEFGFSALPGGYGYYSGGFVTAGDYGHWWTSKEGEINTDNAYYRIMCCSNDFASWNNFDSCYLLSVRYVQGDEVPDEDW